METKQRKEYGQTNLGNRSQIIVGGGSRDRRVVILGFLARHRNLKVQSVDLGDQEDESMNRTVKGSKVICQSKRGCTFTKKSRQEGGSAGADQRLDGRRRRRRGKRPGQNAVEKANEMTQV